MTIIIIILTKEADVMATGRIGRMACVQRYEGVRDGL
jgi:hypothetical protein